jgi:hypothetical protein
MAVASASRVASNDEPWSPEQGAHDVGGQTQGVPRRTIHSARRRSSGCGLRGDTREHFAHETALADTGGADDGHDDRRTLVRARS